MATKSGQRLVFRFILFEYDVSHQVGSGKIVERDAAGVFLNQHADALFHTFAANQTVRVTLGELETAEAALASADDIEPASGETLGLTLATLTPDERSRLTIGDDVHGVVVTGVAPESDAAAKGMQVGDVIVEVGRKPVRTPSAAVEEVDRLQQEGQTSILLLVNREGSNLFVALRTAES